MTADELILTRGQQLTDMLVWGMVSRVVKTKCIYNPNAITKTLKRYIDKIGGTNMELVDKLKTALEHSFAKTTDMRRLRAVALARTTLEAYIEKHEIAAGKRTQIQKNQGGCRPGPRKITPRGWSVSKNRHGMWRINLTSMFDGRPRQVRGTYQHKEDAKRVARRLIKEIRSGI